MAKAATGRPQAKFDLNIVAGSIQEAMKAVDGKAEKLWMIPPGQIQPIEGFNIRIKDSPSHRKVIEEIKQSIRKSGFLRDKPLGGYVISRDGKDVVMLTKGHRRLEAVKELIDEGLPFERLPVVLVKEMPSIEELTTQFYTENTDQRPTMMESALIAKRMLNYGKTEEETAAAMGVTKTQIKNYLTLLSCPKGVRELVISERIVGTEAIVAYKKSKENCEEVLKAAVAAKEASGKGRASRKDIEAAEAGQEKAVRMVPTKTEITLAAGQVAAKKELGNLLSFVDKDLYRVVDGNVEAVENFRVVVTTYRPKKEEPKAETETEKKAKPEKVKQAPAKKPSGKAAPTPAPETPAEEPDDIAASVDPDDIHVEPDAEGEGELSFDQVAEPAESQEERPLDI